MRFSDTLQNIQTVGPGHRSGKAILCGLVLSALAGCANTDRMRTSSIPTADYRVRHPIALTNATTTVDVFLSGTDKGIDVHSAKQIIAFAKEYHQTGHGPVLVLMPAGPAAASGSATIAGIKRALAAGGVRSQVDVQTYPIGDPKLASPVRLSYEGLKAQVGDECGQWPSDIATGAGIDGWDNKPYYNFGCSVQSMVAAQTADPRDLVTPRGEEPADTLIRARAIEDIRNGKDPTTNWSVHNSSIGSVGSN